MTFKRSRSVVVMFAMTAPFSHLQRTTTLNLPVDDGGVHSKRSVAAVSAD
jgi:hypothetical protein